MNKLLKSACLLFSGIFITFFGSISSMPKPEDASYYKLYEQELRSLNLYFKNSLNPFQQEELKVLIDNRTASGYFNSTCLYLFKNSLNVDQQIKLERMIALSFEPWDSLS